VLELRPPTSLTCSVDKAAPLNEPRNTTAMERVFFIAGAVAAFVGVALGAFGAHSLKSRLPDDLLTIFETGVRYQMYHAFGLIAVAWAKTRWPEHNLNGAGWAFIVGILIFSGSLYLLSFTGLRWFGAITPLGGLAFLLGWAILVWSLGR
jgi:uncharacterized membrane protein YgdD (TMEM256/DUF423 family)